MARSVQGPRFSAWVALPVAMTCCTFTTVRPASVHAQQAASAPAADEWIVNGQVLDAVGSGIAGAAVQIEIGGDEKTEGRVIGRASTEPNGDFRIKLPNEPTEKLSIRVRKERFATFFAPVEFEAGEREAFADVEMAGAMSVRGQVSAAVTGRPIEGAEVTIDIQDRKWTAKTSEAGRFEIHGLPAGVGLLIVSRDGFARSRQPVRVEADEPETQVRLQPERQVRLRVVDDRGEPVPEAEVEVQAGNDVFATMADANGRADLHGIGPDVPEVAWRASHPDGVRMLSFDRVLRLGEAPESMPTSGPAASQPAIYTIVLPRGGKVAGKITDAVSGEPVNGARVVVVSGPASDTPMEWTDMEGKFEIAGVMPGPILVAIQHPDYAPELLEDQARAGWTRQIPIRLGKGKPLSGVVDDEAGKVLDQVQVVCTQWRDHDVIGLRALTDEQGRFTFQNAPDGPIEFAFHRPGGGTLRKQILTAGKTDYRFTLPAAAKPAATPDGDQGVTGSGPIQIGKPAPDFAVTALDGTAYRLSRLRGKYVFVDVWATWSPPCRAEMPALKQLQAEIKSRTDFVMLGVSLDATPDAVKAFAEKEELTWPLAAGPSSGAEAAAEAFGVKFIPFNFLVGPDGKVVALETHGPQLLERIRDLAKPSEKKP